MRADDEKASADQPSERIRVIFLHLDLGIGGAEQLVLQLASASKALGHEVLLVTTRCEPHHCFAPVRPPDGPLYPSLRVWGEWIPADLWGRGRTFCSTLRVLYLTFRIAVLLNNTNREQGDEPSRTDSSKDVVVVDVLPTPLPFLAQLTRSSLLYYCHFPDKLLKRNSDAGGVNSSQHKPQQSSPWKARPKALATQLYRSVMDTFEAGGMRAADMIVVNSFFTRGVTLESFPFLQICSAALPVLYPALDTSSLDAWRESSTSEGTSHVRPGTKRKRIVSLNRYERKKNLDLLLKAMDWVRHHRRGREKVQSLQEPEIIMAGGYDEQNAENVEHLQELKDLASQLGLAVEFRCSISDSERAELLHTALVVVYTPSNEHFGIVPLEAMYSGTCVIAVNNGGPTESIRHGVSGFLCENTPAAFGAAILSLLDDPDLAVDMGRAGYKHVVDTFGEDRLKSEWKALIEQTVIMGEHRRRSSRLRWIVLLVVMVLFLTACLILFPVNSLIRGHRPL